MLWINGKLYTFYEHFVEQAARRQIKIEWVEHAILEPDDIGFSQTTGRYSYDKFIIETNRIVRAVVDENELMIVTTHFVKPKAE